MDGIWVPLDGEGAVDLRKNLEKFLRISSR